jgi:hypothetical protein
MQRSGRHKGLDTMLKIEAIRRAADSRAAKVKFLTQKFCFYGRVRRARQRNGGA